MERWFSIALQGLTVILLALILVRPTLPPPNYPAPIDYRQQITRLTKLLSVICSDIEEMTLGDKLYPPPAC